MMGISSRIKYLRESKDISQAKLAKEIGVSAGNVGDWEREKAKPGADAIIAIANFFNVSTDWLLTGRGKGPSKEDADFYLTEGNENYISKQSTPHFKTVFPDEDSQLIIEDNRKELKKRDKSLSSPSRLDHETIISSMVSAGKSLTMKYYFNELLKKQPKLNNALATPENIINILDWLKKDVIGYNAIPINLDLSEEEIELVKMYRRLTEKQKGKVERYIEEMLEKSDENKKETLSFLTNGEEEAATKEMA